VAVAITYDLDALYNSQSRTSDIVSAFSFFGGSSRHDLRGQVASGVLTASPSLSHAFGGTL